MGLTHTPRVIAAIARGFFRRGKNAATPERGNFPGSGLGLDNPHIFQARAGLLDVDYLGHLNNASYLSNAELARWDMTAYSGLMSTMYQDKVNFLVASASVRFRQEIRPIFRKFQIETSIVGLSDKHIYFLQSFRYPGQDENRLRAQVLAKGVAVRDRSVIDPRVYFKEIGYAAELVDELSVPHEQGQKTMDQMMASYDALEESLRDVAEEDDKRQAE